MRRSRAVFPARRHHSRSTCRCARPTTSRCSRHKNWGDSKAWTTVAPDAVLDRKVTFNAAAFWTEIYGLMRRRPRAPVSSRIVFNVSPSHSTGLVRSSLPGRPANWDLGLSAPCVNAELTSFSRPTDATPNNGGSLVDWPTATATDRATACSRSPASHNASAAPRRHEPVRRLTCSTVARPSPILRTNCRTSASIGAVNACGRGTADPVRWSLTVSQITSPALRPG